MFLYIQPHYEEELNKGCVFLAGVTIVVSQTVFALVLSRMLTKTSETIPLLGREHVGGFKDAFGPNYSQTYLQNIQQKNYSCHTLSSDLL